MAHISSSSIPVLTYYILTFTISWGALLVAVGFGGLPRNPEQLTNMIPVLIVAMLGGPSVASAVLTGVAGGKAAYLDPPEPAEGTVSCIQYKASCWRPRRDLNPCYRRESTRADGKLLKRRSTDGYLKRFQ